MKRLRLLSSFEWRYHTRQHGFRFAVLGFAALGVFVQGRLGFGPNIDLNAPYVIAYTMSMLSLLSVFASMVFCASAMLRDTDHRMAELICSTPVGKRDFLLARFGGAFGATLCTVCAMALGMFGATFLPLDAYQQLGPRVPGNYLLAMTIIIAPNVLLVSALLFALAAFSRSMIATYVGAVFLYALYWIGAIFGGSPMMAQASPPTADGLTRAALLDPFGISALLEQTMHWSAAEKNSQLISLSGNLLSNRLLCLGVAGLILTLAYRRFRFKPALAATGKQGPAAQIAAPAPSRPRVVVPARQAQWRALLVLTRLELGVVLKGAPFIAMMLIWVFLVTSALFEGIDNADGGARALAHTALLLRQFQPQLLPMFGTLLVIFYSGELAWRERVLRMDALLDCTPVPGAAFFAAKLLALVSLPMLMIAVAIACALAFQLAMAYPVSEPALYLSLFYYAGLPLALTATLAMFFQAVTPNKYLGMLLTAAVAFTASSSGAALGIEHPMLRFAQAPQLAWSDMNGYGASGVAFHWYMVYWGALAALLALAGLGWWTRGQQRRPARRLALAVGQLGTCGRLLALLCAPVLLGTAGAIYYQTNVSGDYANAHTQAGLRARYEQRYLRYQDLPQAQVEAVRSNVDLFPAQERYRIKGEYRLRNHSGGPIAQLLVESSGAAIGKGMALSGARVLEHDARLGLTLYRFEPALAPGQQAVLRFELEGRQSPFSDAGGRVAAGANATVLFAPGLLPGIGYRPDRQLDNPVERTRHGLPPAAAPPRIEAEIAARKGDFRDTYDWRTFDTTISTEADQIAFAPGRLLKTWRSAGRHYFHYRSDGALRNVAGFFSGRYASSKTAHDGVSIEIYHHPGHAANLPAMRAAAMTSLDYFKRAFGPYPHDHLRIIEVPYTAGLTGFAMPGTILIGEQGGFMADLRPGHGTDQVTRRIAHEVAHQWWGHQLDPAPVEGSSVLVETLAKYAEMRILGQTHGVATVRQLAEFELARYLDGSADAEEPELPLYRASPGQNYLVYSKGAVVMHALTESIGSGPIESALRSVLAAHAHPRKRATTLDLSAALGRAAPGQQALIDESFRQIALYQLKAARARYQRLADGRYRVTLQVDARKLRIDEVSGRASESGIDLPLLIGVYDRDPGDDHAQTLHLKAYRIAAGQSELNVVVRHKPGMVAIEPELRLIERDRRDNFAVPVEQR
jgi:ABC-2 type transport system permease protein